MTGEKCNRHANSKRTWEPSTKTECACKTQTVHKHYESQGGGETNSPHVHWVMEEGNQCKHELRSFSEVHHGLGEAVEFDFVAGFCERVGEHVSGSAQMHVYVSVVVGDEVAKEMLPATEVFGLLAHAHVFSEVR